MFRPRDLPRVFPRLFPRWLPRPALFAVLGGVSALLVTVPLLVIFSSSSSSSDRFFAPILKEASADLEDGDYDFLPNRRSVWIVNRSNGRMANYTFHDDELGSVDRSRVASIDLKEFPRKDTVLRLSDRNLNNILWVCNVRTGDVQMWHLGRDGILRAETMTSSTDLMEKAPPASSGK